jgi:hypothetical protein
LRLGLFGTSACATKPTAGTNINRHPCHADTLALNSRRTSTGPSGPLRNSILVVNGTGGAQHELAFPAYTG